MRSSGLSALLLPVILAQDWRKDQDGDKGAHEDIISRVVSGISAKNLRAHVEKLCENGPRDELMNHKSMASAKTYIESQLRDMGYKNISREVLTGVKVGERVPENIILEITGSAEPNSVYEIGAHMDSVKISPGADDNASGVAALLEIARVLKGTRLKNTLRLCFFTMEESSLQGSQTHAANLLAEKKGFGGVIILEMIGYYSEEKGSQKVPANLPFKLPILDVGNFIAVVGNKNSSGLCSLFEQSAKKHVHSLKYFNLGEMGEYIQDAYRSDHAMYWKSGLKGIMITDTADFRNPNYHKETDKPGTLNYEFMAKITMATAATALKLAEIAAE